MLVPLKGQSIYKDVSTIIHTYPDVCNGREDCDFFIIHIDNSIVPESASYRLSLLSHPAVVT